ncbi:MAG: helix-turn-helix domain-containing protein [Thalassotalea sp.]|nr:helix-turn-helix domain-containing protein [Thalassotalea sp.]
MSTPLPGQSVRGSKTGKPIMALLDLLGRTWSLGIIWNLSNQVLTFRELQSLCDGISPTLLNTRLKELRVTNIIEKTGKGYALTAIGEKLLLLIYPMGDWATMWRDHLIALKGSSNDG